jgi:acetolactate synthase-1/2/3 large subunit
MNYIFDSAAVSDLSEETGGNEPSSIRARLLDYALKDAQANSVLAEPMPTVSERLIDGLLALGVTHAFGLFGGGIAPFYEAMSRSRLKLVLCRHETGAAFSAIEASLASGKLTVVVSTTGPGVTNLLTGMVAARWEGAKVLFISGCTRAAQRGRFAFQETAGGGSPLQALYMSGTLFNYASTIEDPAELETALSRIASGINQTGGFVAHIGLPTNIQNAAIQRRMSTVISALPSARCDAATVTTVRELLVNDPFVIWAGFGAREAAAEVRAFAELTNAKVMCTPRAKGIFPENHPQYLGVTGLGGANGLIEGLSRARPHRVLVLGSRLGEMSSFWSPSLVPPGGLIHIDIDPSVFGSAYPNVPTIGVPYDVRSVIRSLIESWPRRTLSRINSCSQLPPRQSMRAESGRVRPSFLMQAIQSIVVDRSRAIVLTEAGNSFALGNHYLRFSEPKRYRVSTGFGSMGHATSGVIGATIGSSEKAVAVVGDGALLMLNEISTAANYAIPAVWIVLNDSRYGMISQGMESLGWTPFETEFPEADFVSIAKAMGASGIRVESEAKVEQALSLAMSSSRPFVVDVMIDCQERAPAGQRNQSLMKQTSGR